jgi:hypothetical protein
MNVRAKTAEPCKPGYDRAYHIEPNATLDRWDVIGAGRSRDNHR